MLVTLSTTTVAARAARPTSSGKVAYTATSPTMKSHRLRRWTSDATTAIAALGAGPNSTAAGTKTGRWQRSEPRGRRRVSMRAAATANPSSSPSRAGWRQSCAREHSAATAPAPRASATARVVASRDTRIGPGIGSGIPLLSRRRGGVRRDPPASTICPPCPRPEPRARRTSAAAASPKEGLDACPIGWIAPGALSCDHTRKATRARGRDTWVFASANRRKAESGSTERRPSRARTIVPGVALLSPQDGRRRTTVRPCDSRAGARRPIPPKPPMREPLRFPAFRRLAASYALNELGWSFAAIALAVLVFDRTGSPLATTALFLATMFVPALAAPALVAHLDRLPVRRGLPALYLAEAAVFAGLVVVSSHFSLPAVITLALADGVVAIAGRALTRATGAAVLKPAGLLERGNMLLNVLFSVGYASGPAIAGAVVARAGVAASLAVTPSLFRPL